MAFFGFLAPLFKGVVGKAVVSSVASSVVNGVIQNAATKKQNALNAAAASAEREQALGDQAEQFVRLREAAEAGGFNPLTVLRAAPNSGMPVHTGIPAMLASGSILKNAFAAGVNTWFNAPQIKADAERDQLERRIMREELIQLQKSNALPKQFGFEIPQTQTTTNVARGLNPDGTVQEIVIPYWVTVLDQKTGRKMPMINPEVTETGPGELLTSSIVLGGSDFLANSGGFMSRARAPAAKAPNRAEVWRNRQ